MSTNALDRDTTVFSDELWDVAQAIVARYPNPRSAILPLLFLAQSVEGYVTEAGMRSVADVLDLTPAEVLAVASFYTMLKQRPQGDYLISVCRNLSCTHRGAREVIAALQERLGIEAGETTPDGVFTLETAECLATCDGAPSLQINYEDFYGVTPQEATRLVDRLVGEEEVRSVRAQTVRRIKDVSYEIATAGLEVPAGATEPRRTVGGESPPADMAPGFRPKAQGEERGDG